MENEKKLLILGAGQYGQVLKEVALATNRYSRISFLDDTPSENVIGELKDYKMFTDQFSDAIVAIGNPDIRMHWLDELSGYYQIPVIIHPTAYVSPSAKIGKGSIVEPLSIIHTSVKVGEGCIISAGAVVNHNSILSKGVHCDCGCVIPARSEIEPMRKVVQGEINLR